jgi:hypothetical protein
VWTFAWKYEKKSAFWIAAMAVVMSGLALFGVIALFNRVTELCANVNAIDGSHIQPQIAPTMFVNRTSVGTSLQTWVDNNEANTLIVYGPRGAGKTTLVHNALVNKTGVINVSVSHSRPSIACAVVTRLGLTRKGELLPCEDKDVGILKQLFVEASIRLGGVLPVIVVDVAAERETAEALAHSVVRQAKRMVVDNAMARCILIFSDATLVFAFNEDTTRRTLLYVDSFTVDEANQFVDHYQLPWDASFREEVFEKVGTRPSSLALVKDKFKDSAENFDDFVEMTNELACNLVTSWVASPSVHALLHRIAVAPNGEVRLWLPNFTFDMEPVDLLRTLKTKGHLVIYDGARVMAYSPPMLRAIRCWHMDMGQNCNNPKYNCTVV